MDDLEIKAISTAVTEAVSPLADRVSAIERTIKKKSILTSAHDAIRGYRTLIVAGAVAVVPPLVDYFASPDIQAQLGISPRTAVIMGALFMVLRIITKGPVPPLKQ